jgi:hypothetical protein
LALPICDAPKTVLASLPDLPGKRGVDRLNSAFHDKVIRAVA